jgi:drug/metabolite transporter (DMT)-like permease
VPLGIATGGILFFGETLGWHGLVGGLLIVAGSVCPTLLNNRRPAPAAAKLADCEAS